MSTCGSLSETRDNIIIKTEKMNEEAKNASKVIVFPEDELLHGTQSSESEGEKEDLTNQHDNLLAYMEAQVQPPWPQPQPIAQPLPQPKKSLKWNLANFYKMFVCTFCKEKFYSKVDLIQHFRETHNTSESTTINVITDVEFNLDATPGEIFSRTNDPNYRHLANDMFKCNKCKDKFDGSFNIIQHWITAHMAEQPSCCQCGLPFQAKHEQERHNLKYHSIRCRICSRAFFNQPDVDEHLLTLHLCDPSGMKIHIANFKEFSCGICIGRFDFRNRRWQHMAKMHRLVAKEAENLYEDFSKKKRDIATTKAKRIKGKSETSSKGSDSSGDTVLDGAQTLKFEESKKWDHNRKRLDNSTIFEAKIHPRRSQLHHCCNTFKCSFCSQELHSRNGIIQHFRDYHSPMELSTTTIESTEQTENNDEATPSVIFSRTNDQYYRHILGDLFKCDLCSQLFSSSSNIVQHWIEEHKAEPHTASCCSCGLPYRYKTEMERHKQRCHTPTKIPCRVCGEKFFNRKDFDEHLLSDHLCDPSGKPIHHTDNLRVSPVSCPNCSGLSDFRNHDQVSVQEEGNGKNKRKVGKRKQLITCLHHSATKHQATHAR